MNDVSRETPPVPAAATGVFSRRLELAERFAGFLVGAGVERGLLGPREAPRIWERHLLNCAVIEELCPIGSSVADIGSGAGLPGLALAIARPDLRVTLIEPLQRRSEFLREAVDILGVHEQVEVVRSRAEDLVGEAYDRVTSRAVAPLGRLAQWSLPLLGPDGEIVAIKGSSADDELASARKTLSRLGVRYAEVVVVGAGRLAQPTTVVRMG
jgi:16S rRNA (guanine527-N7)-methyltransferase